MLLKKVNKIAGAIVGALLYPIKSLLVNLIFFSFSILFLLFFGLPYLIFTEMKRKGHSFLPSLPSLFVALLLTIFVAPFLAIPSFVACFLFQAPLVIYDFVRHIRFGLSDGYKNGLFFHVIKRVLFDVEIFSWLISFSAIISGVHQAQEELDEDVTHSKNVAPSPNFQKRPTFEALNLPSNSNVINNTFFSPRKPETVATREEASNASTNAEQHPTSMTLG